MPQFDFPACFVKSIVCQINFTIIVLILVKLYHLWLRWSVLFDVFVPRKKKKKMKHLHWAGSHFIWASDLIYVLDVENIMVLIISENNVKQDKVYF